MACVCVYFFFWCDLGCILSLFGINHCCLLLLFLYDNIESIVLSFPLGANNNKNNNRRPKGTAPYGGRITLLTALVAVAGDNFVPCIQVQGFQ